MKTFSKILISSVLLAATGVGVAAAEEPQEPAEQPSSVASLTAEVWPFEMPGDVSPKVAFEQWRARLPEAGPEILAIEGLAIPARVRATMVRVSGVLTAPLTGDYAFLIHAPALHPFARPDETELWIQNDVNGEWRLAQTTGNPNKRSGRTRLDSGAPRRFELWTMGRNAISVEWQLHDFETKDPATGQATTIMDRQAISSTALGPRTPTQDDRHATGLRDSWKQRHGLALDQADGPPIQRDRQINACDPVDHSKGQANKRLRSGRRLVA